MDTLERYAIGAPRPSGKRDSVMKRAGGLYGKIWSYDNLMLATHRAQKAKRYRPDVLLFNLRLEDHLHRLSDELRSGTWQPSGHRHFQIFEPKPRWISAAPYSDRVVHHALCNVINPTIDKRLIYDCWANRRGKGTHRAVRRYQSFSRRYRFALKMDIRKYFPSIDHEILKRQLSRTFKESKLLQLMFAIIDDGTVPEPHHQYFPDDDLFAPFQHSLGLPIGNLTSQLWSNSYLCGFDHWVKQQLGAGAYLRFVDDFVLLNDSKLVLADWARTIRNELGALRLSVHAKKCVIRSTSEGVPFLGYMIWPERIRVRGATVRRFRRHYRSIRVRNPERAARSLAAWRGHTELRWLDERGHTIATIADRYLVGT